MEVSHTGRKGSNYFVTSSGNYNRRLLCFLWFSKIIVEILNFTYVMPVER
jgi:hypothetical protein